VLIHAALNHSMANTITVSPFPSWHCRTLQPHESVDIYNPGEANKCAEDCV
jgi:hypothetical protein